MILYELEIDNDPKYLVSNCLDISNLCNIINNHKKDKDNITTIVIIVIISKIGHILNYKTKKYLIIK